MNNSFISKTAVIYENVKIGKGCIIHDFVVIYPNVTIEDGVEIFDHCVIGKLPKAPGCNARKIETSFSNVIIGENCILSPGVVIYAGTKIGNNTLIGDNGSLRENCSIGQYCIISRNVSVNYNTIIGNYTKIMDNSHITGDCIVGNHVFISVLVATTNDNAMGRDGYDSKKVTGPIIGDGSTIGAGANLLPNVKIGKNCIVGASALVTKDVPDNKVVMGIPARIIRNVEEKE